MPMVSQPAPVPGGEATVGVSDTLVSAFFSPAKVGAFIWGVGPVLSLPSTSERDDVDAIHAVLEAPPRRANHDRIAELDVFQHPEESIPVSGHPKIAALTGQGNVRGTAGHAARAQS
jgi:hypothetical protein